MIGELSQHAPAAGEFFSAEVLKQTVMNTGAVAVGIAECGEVDNVDKDLFEEWLASGYHAGMLFMERNGELRSNPELLLSGTKSVISCAFSFAGIETDFTKNCGVSCYAVGDDYHEVIREKLKNALYPLFKSAGEEFRICVDSAPIRERYWACRAGVGYIGDNGCLIVPGYGSKVFLAEILTTSTLACDTPLSENCGHCGACLKACPGNAISEKGIVNCNRCLSYLTIEHHGEFSDNQCDIAARGGYPLFGCDKCLQVCPHNAGLPPTRIKEFQQRSDYDSLSREEIADMSQAEFSTLFRRSPIKRAKLEGLQRNIGSERKPANSNQ